MVFSEKETNSEGSRPEGLVNIMRLCDCPDDHTHQVTSESED